MGEEQINEYEEEICTQSTEDGFWINSKKVYAKDRNMDKVKK